MLGFVLLLCWSLLGGCWAIIPFTRGGGLETTILQHPWMLSITNMSGWHGCGASLIAVYPNATKSDIGLTAAHCFRGHLVRGWPLRAQILAGVTVDNFNYSSGEKRLLLEVRNYGFFPGDDAALFKLDSPLPFTDRIKPVELPPQGYLTPHDASCTVTGWGMQQNNPLMELPVSLQACNAKKFDYGSNFCAGGTVGSICSGDSGGPLMCRNEEGRPVQQGIVSYSDPSCGDHPATYARISFYVDWIVNTARSMSSLPASPATPAPRQSAVL